MEALLFYYVSKINNRNILVPSVHVRIQLYLWAFICQIPSCCIGHRKILSADHQDNATRLPLRTQKSSDLTAQTISPRAKILIVNKLDEMSAVCSHPRQSKLYLLQGAFGSGKSFGYDDFINLIKSICITSFHAASPVFFLLFGRGTAFHRSMG